MSYPPLAEVRKDLRVEWYRCPIEGAKLRELSRRSDLQGLYQAGGHLALFLLTGAVTYFFWLQQIWVGVVVGLFLHGTVGTFFRGIAVHELAHGSVFKTKILNKIFLYLLSLLTWWDVFDYASSHTYHHRYTLHPEGDREVLLPIKPMTGKTFLLQMFTMNIWTQKGRTFGRGGLIPMILNTIRTAMGTPGLPKKTTSEWVNALHEDQPDQHRRAIWFARAQLAFHAAVVVVSVVTGQWIWMFLLTFFTFTAGWAVYMVGLPQHCGLRDNVPDFRKCVRSNTLIPILEFLYWRMNWHLEHHMYAGVPCYNLKKLHHEVAHDMPKPRTLRSAWREMLDTWNRQQEDPDYQYDTPLPATAGRLRERDSDELESSIGDLAPKGLQ